MGDREAWVTWLGPAPSLPVDGFALFPSGTSSDATSSFTLPNFQSKVIFWFSDEAPCLCLAHSSLSDSPFYPRGQSFGRAQTPPYSSPVSFAGSQASQVVSDLFKRLETVSSWPLFLSVPLEEQVSGESSLLNYTSPKGLLYSPL